LQVIVRTLNGIRLLYLLTELHKAATSTQGVLFFVYVHKKSMNVESSSCAYLTQCKKNNNSERGCEANVWVSLTNQVRFLLNFIHFFIHLPPDRCGRCCDAVFPNWTFHVETETFAWGCFHMLGENRILISNRAFLWELGYWFKTWLTWARRLVCTNIWYLSDNNCTDSFNSKFSDSLKSFARFKLWIFVLQNLKTNYL